MNKYYTQFNIFFLVLSIIISLLVFLFFSINANEKTKVDTLKQNIVEKSLFNYYSVLELHLWHTSNDALYVKNNNITKTNKYLSDNTIEVNKDTLIRLSHTKLLKQFSRYSKGFNSFYYSLSSLNPLNEKNLPDSFEKKGLTYLTQNKDKQYFYGDIEHALEKGTFDFIGELRVTQSCLKCHAKEGYIEGDLKGGIRITIDTTDIKNKIDIIESEFFNLRLITVFFGLFLITLVYWIVAYIFKQRKQLQQLNENLEHLVVERTQELHELNDTLEDRIKKAVAKLKEQENLMILQSRHAAMGEMINMIAHQWRQPIAAISMGANNMLLDIELGDLESQSVKEMSDDILHQTQYLTKTIDDFSNFFKPGKEKISIYPKDVIEESLSMIRKTLENNNIKLITTLEDTQKIYTYSRELLQVIINIIKNAKEAFDNDTQMDKKIIVYLQESSDSISIRISDNAGGIPDEIFDKIFDPYFSTKQEKNGTGLGLYMSKTIIDKHLLGKITAENLNDGASFTIELPKG